MTIYVVTHRTRDCPNLVVLRRHVLKTTARGPEFVADYTPLAIAKTIEEIRRFLPLGLRRGPLLAEDDPVITEWWTP